MKNYFLISLGKLFFLFFLYNTAFANSIDPKKFIQEIIDDVKTTLVSSNTKEYKVDSLSKLAKARVDINGIGLYSLGPYRKKINDKQKKEYAILFEKYFIKTFTSRLSDYSDPEINITGSDKKNDNYTVVSSVLLATEQRPEVKIEWVVYTKNPDKPLIRDLIIEGLKLARTQKEEFTSIIQSNDENINALLIKLRDFTN
mgnify:CR=1 FL=1